MPRSAREDLVLQFLLDKNIALPPMAIFRGMKREHSITFTYSTVQRILSDLTDEGFVVRCDKGELDEGRIAPLPDDEKDRRTYYFITDQGRERIASDED